MARLSQNNNSTVRRPGGATKYDAHHTVLAKTYGPLADLRRELADSKSAVAERTELLGLFADCADSQRAWLLLEDYFEKLSLSRKDFSSSEWWPRLLSARGRPRLEETAILFMRAKRSIPPELVAYANFNRFAEVEQQEEEHRLIQQIEDWLHPASPQHLEAPRASLRVVCAPEPKEADSALHHLRVQFHLIRPRAGEKQKPVAEIAELVARSAHERELFPAEDWQFIEWLAAEYGDKAGPEDTLLLVGTELLRWLGRWGDKARLETPAGERLHFPGQVAEMEPALEPVNNELHFLHRLKLPSSETQPLHQVQFFAGDPAIALHQRTFYLVRQAPPPGLLNVWVRKQSLPVHKLSRRLITHLHRQRAPKSRLWQDLCVVHMATPQFIFELAEDTVRLRLLARSEKDKSLWQWTGHDWQAEHASARTSAKPEILDDPRLDPSVQWLRRLDWFTPEPGLWVGDANENFLDTLALAWPDRPKDAEYLGNPSFHRLFLQPRQLKPKLMVKGSGIDWLSVSVEWEMEGLKLTAADLERLQRAGGRFVKLPDAGWVELDSGAVQSAHETFAELGLDGLVPVAQRVGMEQAVHLEETAWQQFANTPQFRSLRDKTADFKGIAPTPLPETIQAELRPYQKEGFDFLCHLNFLHLGGILADDMGLGKTLQTLCWLAWLKKRYPKDPKPVLVICPASVLHNWRREAERFTPGLKTLILSSGSARHNLRKQIPEHDIIVTNYALLRRDWEALQKFDFRVIILDEAQFIKNPAAQVTQSVKQLKAQQRLALTGTPLENRLLDLWSIADFVQPGYLGTQEKFIELYEPGGPDAESAQRVARRRLAARLRPLMLRRLKKQVAKDLPDRIEQRYDCDLGEDQRKLYLAELRRSRDEVAKTVREKGLARSKIQVLAALTRLRQICCHPQLVGSDTNSGKTETLFELLEPLLAEGQKVLVFSQFVQMLKLLEAECAQRGIPTHILTGETKQRQETVNAFQEDTRPGVFLLSLRAAGTGLNLTAASYVVLYDPWWNPAVEAQAIDRSHRIGQTQTVNAYRLIAPGTVEEKIWDLQQRKSQTIADVLGEEGFARSLSQIDLEYLFAEE